MRIVSLLLMFSLGILGCGRKSTVQTAYVVATPDTLSKGIVADTGNIVPPAIVDAAAKSRPVITVLKTPAAENQTAIIPLINFEHYNIEDFLHVSSVKCAFQDSKGNFWFGTIGGGTIEYDGINTTVFNQQQGLAYNTVLCITEDRKGNLWFGTTQGLSCYDGRIFTTFTTAAGLPDNAILCMHEDKNNNLWIGTSKGLSRYDGSKFTTYTTEQGLAGDRVISILETKSGNLWLGTASGASRYDGGKFENYSTDNGLGANIVNSMAEDKNGNIWFATYGGGATVLKNKICTVYSVAQGLPDDRVNNVAADENGNVWLATSAGISCYDSGKFTNYTTAQGLGDNEVRSITEDKNGNIWFVTKTDISVYDFKQLVFYNRYNSNGPAKFRVKCSTEDRDGNMWFGTDGDGLSKYDGKNFTTYGIGSGLGDTLITSIIQDHTGNLWFTTNFAGVYRFDGRSFANYAAAQGLGHEVDVFQCIREDRDGNLWFGSNGAGAIKYDDKSFATYTSEQGLAGNNIRCITLDSNGRLWFGTESGLSIYDGKTFTNYTVANGLAGNEVNAITEISKEKFFIGTKKGLSCISLPGGSVTSARIHNFTTFNGLPDNAVTQVVSLSDGKVMLGFGSKVGLAVFDPGAPLDVGGRLALTLFNSSTDYPVKGINDNPGPGCLYQDRTGCIWAGMGAIDTRAGLLRFDYKGYKKSRGTPRPQVVAVGDIKVNWQDIPWHLLSSEANKSNFKTDSLATAAQQMVLYNRILSPAERDSICNRFSGISFDQIAPFYALPQNLRLPYSNNNVTISFNCLAPLQHNLVNYRYKLQGYDTGWSPALKKQEATFGNINEGHYVFMVKGQSPDGAWSEPVTYAFTVLPPWYRTLWAYVLYITGIVSLLFIVYRWRIASLRKRQKELEQTVRERTAEIVQKNIIVEEQKKELEVEKTETERQFRRSEELLLNILPVEVAEELKHKGHADAKYFSEVTVLFTDFVNFTTAGERMTPEELVGELHACFKEFDIICGRHNIEKIKTVGDAYLAVAGLPQPDAHHAVHIIAAALEIRDFMQRRKELLGDMTFGIRIGVNTGPLVAGIVGIKKFAYDIWGDTVNTAARMEQNSENFKINISESTYQLVKDKFTCIHRGKIAAKNKGSVDMYFVAS